MILVRGAGREHREEKICTSMDMKTMHPDGSISMTSVSVPFPVIAHIAIHKTKRRETGVR
jgi:hypothetical protein